MSLLHVIKYGNIDISYVSELETLPEDIFLIYVSKTFTPVNIEILSTRYYHSLLALSARLHIEEYRKIFKEVLLEYEPI